MTNEPPRLRWPLILMIAAAVLSIVLTAIVIWNPSNTAGSYGSIEIAHSKH